MKAQKKHIDELHAEHKAWLSDTKFYEDELKVYQHRLSEVASKNTNTEAAKQVEHFHNQFVIQEEELDAVKQEIKRHEQGLVNETIHNPIAIDHRLFDDHTELRERVETYKKLYELLKTDFNQFLSKWM